MPKVDILCMIAANHVIVNLFILTSCGLLSHKFRVHFRPQLNGRTQDTLGDIIFHVTMVSISTRYKVLDFLVSKILTVLASSKSSA